MSGAISDLSRRPAPSSVVDVVVIGSGYAGATVAWELAAAGREVLVLEEGGDPTLTQRDGEMYDQLYMDRGGRATADLGINVLQGRTLGGGGVINASDVVPLGDGVLAHWRRHYGLTELTPGTLEPYRRRALEDLGAGRIAEDALNRNNRILREGAAALGWHGEVMLHNRQGCIGEGTCLIGCPLHAKMSPRRVAIPAALAAGANVWLRARARRLRASGAELKELEIARLDARGYRELDAFTLRARTVIVAAGAIGSAEFLRHSGVGNEHVGEHLSLQPQLPVSALFGDEVRSFRGIPQAYAVTQFEQLPDETRAWGGFRIEAIGGTPGIVASLLPWVGPEGRERMRAYPQMASSLLLTPDEGLGRVEPGPGGRPVIHYALSPAQEETFRRALRAAARVYFAAGAREVLVPTSPPLVLRGVRELDQVDRMRFPPASAPFLSAHQQGTVRCAPDPNRGAADPAGRVFGTRGVYVMDGSLFPTTASSHIMAPTVTLARYLARRFLAEG